MRVLLFLVLIYPAVSFGIQTGNDLLAECSEELHSSRLSSCLGYLQGLDHSHNTFLWWKQLKEPQYCIPDGVTVGQLRDIVLKYLKERPEELHLEPSGLALNAWITAFPPKFREDYSAYCP